MGVKAKFFSYPLSRYRSANLWPRMLAAKRIIFAWDADPSITIIT